MLKELWKYKPRPKLYIMVTIIWNRFIFVWKYQTNWEIGNIAADELKTPVWKIEQHLSDEEIQNTCVEIRMTNLNISWKS